MDKSVKSPKLPKMDSIQELARFWQNHEVTEFENDMEEVTEPVFVRDSTITLNLPAREAKAIQKLAKSQGLSKEEMIHRWVKQKLAKETGH
jgi:predicted DNA binding CopG/RHH family protein